MIILCRIRSLDKSEHFLLGRRMYGRVGVRLFVMVSVILVLSFRIILEHFFLLRSTEIKIILPSMDFVPIVRTKKFHK